MTLLQALADERKTLEKEMRDYSAEIKSLIGRRFEKWLALQKIENEMKTLAGRMD